MNTSATTETIILGGGCFWCLEAAYQMVRGVARVTSGYAGGSVPDPTYQAVCSGRTGHAEVVQVEFDPGTITLREILDIFWIVHDPTTKDRQGADVGSQYRSAIYYCGPSQLPIIQKAIQAAQKLWPNPIVTEVAPLATFYLAETEHQNYFKNHPERAYCQTVINPKLKKLREAYASKLSE